MAPRKLTCEMCGKKFKSSGWVDRHMRTAHPTTLTDALPKNIEVVDPPMTRPQVEPQGSLLESLQIIETEIARIRRVLLGPSD